MKKQLRALGDFWREEYGRYVGMTAIAFLVLVVLAYIAGRLFPDIPVTVIGAFNEVVAGSGIVQEDGSFDVLALFGNNLRAWCCPFCTALSLSCICPPYPWASTPRSSACWPP